MMDHSHTSDGSDCTLPSHITLPHSTHTSPPLRMGSSGRSLYFPILLWALRVLWALSAISHLSRVYVRGIAGFHHLRALPTSLEELIALAYVSCLVTRVTVFLHDFDITSLFFQRSPDDEQSTGGDSWLCPLRSRLRCRPMSRNALGLERKRDPFFCRSPHDERSTGGIRDSVLCGVD